MSRHGPRLLGVRSPIRRRHANHRSRFGRLAGPASRAIVPGRLRRRAPIRAGSGHAARKVPGRADRGAQPRHQRRGNPRHAGEARPRRAGGAARPRAVATRLELGAARS